MNIDAKVFKNCTREGIAESLRTISEIQDGHILMAGTLLSCLDPQGNIGSHVYEAALDLLVKANSPLAHDVLWWVGEHHPISRIKVEAVRRSGRFAATGQTRQLLHKWAKDGIPLVHHFQYDNQIDQKSTRIIALEAMKAVPKPDAADVAVLKSVIEEAQNSREKISLLIPALEALAHAIAPHEIGDYLKIVQPLAPQYCLVALVGLNRFSAKALKSHVDEIGTLLLSSCNITNIDSPVLQELVSLIPKILTVKLLREFSDRYSQDCLGNGRGTISLAMCENWPHPDEELTNAYLTFARHPSNANKHSKCVQGLAKCAAGGFGAIIASKLLTGSKGYDSLLEGNGIDEIFGNAANAIGIVAPLLKVDQALQINCLARAILWMGAAGVYKEEDWSSRQKWSPLSGFISARPNGNNQQAQALFKELADHIDGLQADQNPLLAIARLVASDCAEAGIGAVASRMIDPFDEIARLFLRYFLDATANLNLKYPNAIQSESGILSFENVLWDQRGAFRQFRIDEVKKRVVQSGTLNRYLFDLCRRQSFGFAQITGQALQVVKTIDDAAFILDSLLLIEPDSGLALAASATQINHPLQTQIRVKAIQTIVEIAKRNVSTSISIETVSQFQRCFEDQTEVRIAAYKAAGLLGRFEHIQPLRVRLKNERKEEGKQAIKSALDSLKKKLMASQPDKFSKAPTLQWLSNVANLADQSFVEQLKEYLIPPHSEPEIRIAALRGLAEIKAPAGLALVKEFIDETSPSGSVIVEARRTRIILENRFDGELFEELEHFLPEESPLLDATTEYAKIIGTGQIKPVASTLRDAWSQWETGHWDDFVTRLNAIMELLIRQIYRQAYVPLGLSDDQRKKVSEKEYANLISAGYFKSAFPRLQSLCEIILSLRRESPVAHAQNADGSNKAGVNEDDAKKGRGYFADAFTEAIVILQNPANRPLITSGAAVTNVTSPQSPS